MARGLRPGLVLLATVALAAGGAATRAAGAVVARLHVTFSGSSTLHDFRGEAPPVTVTLEPRPGGTWGADVRVPVVGLRTGNGRRDAKMREMLRAAAHPAIRGVLEEIDPDAVRRGGGLPLALEIGGVSRPVVATVSDWRATPGGEALSFTAAFDVSLRDFDLEAPTALLVMRVADEVHVRVDVLVRRTGAADRP